MKLSEKLLKPEQQEAIDRLYGFDETILIAPTGAGKTIICLSAIADLIKEGHLTKVIVACPARVLENLVWPNEAAKWPHLRKLRLLQLQGTSQQRTKALLSCEAEIIVVSLNNLDWLLMQDHDCDGIVVDELSKAAGKQAAKLKSKKWAGRLTWRVGMTATPVSQDFQKLYGMARIIDGGRALGTNKQKYLDTYFYSDYMGFNIKLRLGCDALIMERVTSLVHAITDKKAQELPKLSTCVMRFFMPGYTRKKYNEMKRDMVVGDVEAANEAVKSGKLRQIASGFIYDEGGNTVPLDSTRADCCRRWAEELKGRVGVIFYEYIDQGQAIHAALQKNGGVRTTNIFSHFAAGDARILVAQINSLSHGVDGLQRICADVLFYHPMWSRDATEQAIGRVWRQGQTKEVNVTTLCCNDTLDDLVMARVEDRGEFMKMFMKHLRE